MTLEERKRNFEIAVEECDGKAGTIMSASDQNFATVVELARHAQDNPAPITSLSTRRCCIS